MIELDLTMQISASFFLLDRESKSAYELAVENGFEGTMEEWIESLKVFKENKGHQDRQLI